MNQNSAQKLVSNPPSPSFKHSLHWSGTSQVCPLLKIERAYLLTHLQKKQNDVTRKQLWPIATAYSWLGNALDFRTFAVSHLTFRPKCSLISPSSNIGNIVSGCNLSSDQPQQGKPNVIPTQPLNVPSQLDKATAVQASYDARQAEWAVCEQ